MKKLCTGIGVMDCYAQGRVRLIDDPIEANGTCYGCIIVAKVPTPDIALIIREASGVITQSGGLTCHVALVCLEMGKPAIVGVSNILSLVNDGMTIAIESSDHKGVVYEIS